MLRLQEEEREIAALVNQEQPILMRSVRPGDDWRRTPAKKRRKAPTPARRSAKKLRMRLPGEQIRPFGVREKHLRLGDLLEFGKYRGQRFPAAGFVGAF